MSTFLRGFDGLWARPVEDYREAVKSYLIVVDTNVLLELYRFTPQARQELLDILAQLGKRLWVPHQVVKEYHKRRFDAVREHLDLYTSVPENLKSIRNKALQEVQTLAKRCSMSDADKQLLTAPINDAFEKVSTEIQRHSDAFDLSLAKVVRNDPILSTLAQVLDGKTGDPFSEEESDTLVTAFQERAAEQIPPGYRDAGKPENAHGDFFVWEQLLREAAGRETPVLLVTNDVKPDWVQKEAGYVVGARPELMREFGERCNRDFLMTQLPLFLGMAKEVLGASVSQSTMQQARNIRDVSTSETMLVTLPRRMFTDILNKVSSNTEDILSLPDRMKTDSDRAALAVNDRILRAMTKGRKRGSGDDVTFTLPADHLPPFNEFVLAIQSETSGDSGSTEQENARNEYRLLMKELTDLRELLEMARMEREIAHRRAMESEAAAREVDSDAPADVRDRLAREAEARRNHLHSAMNEVNSLEAQISALAQQLDGTGKAK
ncbi:PIN domain-containing protein [Streptomyces rochei]|uniref:PIN domain-containing protein n=1 Tax=Streptomyces TaxID=1883 RepID=UPI00117D0F67|nr:PIN domain-containing protein [Streptomyces rochei]WDI19723.1 PIN domain-containing protein [Streptomyces enissocaesilis]